MNPCHQPKHLDCSPSLKLCQLKLDNERNNGTFILIPVSRPPNQIKSFYCPRGRRVTADVHPTSFCLPLKRNHIHDWAGIKDGPQAKSFQWPRTHRVHTDVELKSSDANSPRHTGISNQLTSYRKVSQLGVPDRVAEFDTVVIKKQEHEDGKGDAIEHSLVHHEDGREEVQPNLSNLVKASEPFENSVRETFIHSSYSPRSKKIGLDANVDATSSCRFKLGQVADDSDVAVHTPRDSLIQIARLKVNDGAFIKRSDNDWTYAILKARAMGDDPHLVFTVNEKGSTKSFPMSHWAKFIRLPNRGSSSRDCNVKKISQSSTTGQNSPTSGKQTHMKFFFLALKTIQVHSIDVNTSRVVPAK